MGPLTYFFSFEGRIRRTHWWLGSLALVLLPIILVVAILFSMMSRMSAEIDATDKAAVEAWVMREMFGVGPIYLGFFGLAILVAIVSQYSLNMRRYHDRNKTGWWALLAWTPLATGFLAAAGESPALYFVSITLTIVVPIWQLIELGFLSGTPGGNDYGPDPSGGSGSLAGELAALRGPVPEAGNRVWSQNRDESPLYQPVMTARVAPSAMPPRSGPPVFGKRH